MAIGFTVMLFSSAAATATTYWVSTSGSDSNNGTSLDTPFRTIQKAAGFTNPGDTVYVMDGTYGPFLITRSGSASGGYITYQAYPGHRPTINKTGSAWDAIEMANKTGTSYIIIDGFNIVGNARSITVSQALSAKKYNNTTNGNCIGSGKNSNHIFIAIITYPIVQAAVLLQREIIFTFTGMLSITIPFGRH
jgi:Protein of unknown function (DUF1565).